MLGNKMRNMKKIPGYSNYSATKDGRVWTNNLRKGWMVPGVDRNGYLRYGLIGDNGNRKGMYAHQIIALTYIPNPENKRYVNHLDHNKANNSVENLAWCTHLENIRHDWAMGKRKALRGNDTGPRINTPESVREIRKLYQSKELSIPQIAEKFGISKSGVCVIIYRKQWRHI